MEVLCSFKSRYFAFSPHRYTLRKCPYTFFNQINDILFLLLLTDRDCGELCKIQIKYNRWINI